MNAERRKQIEAVLKRLEDLGDEITNLKVDIETIRDEEQEYFDNMPESFQMADRGQAAEAAIEALDSTLDDLDVDTASAISNLEIAKE